MSKITPGAWALETVDRVPLSDSRKAGGGPVWDGNKEKELSWDGDSSEAKGAGPARGRGTHVHCHRRSSLFCAAHVDTASAMIIPGCRSASGTSLVPGKDLHHKVGKHGEVS